MRVVRIAVYLIGASFCLDDGAPFTLRTLATPVNDYEWGEVAACGLNTV